MTRPTPIPAGWYADPDGGPFSRWWDGAQWTSHEPVPPIGGTPRADGVPANTVWIWLVALLPLLGLAVLLYDFQGLFDAMTQVSQSPTSAPSLSLTDIFTPGYFASLLLPLAGTAGTIVFSAFDARELRRRGLVQPFNWAWSLFVLVQGYGAFVYPIGRTVVARRRGARASLIPMIVAIVVQLVVLLVTTLWTLQIMSQMFSLMSTFSTLRS